MTYKHGVYGSEVATSLIPTTNISAGLPVVFGTAPVHLASDAAKPNIPVLCYSYPEAVAAFGYSKDWASYTLCEFMQSQFGLFGMAPVVFVNVLDSSTHKKSVASEAVTITNLTGTIKAPVLLSTLVIKASEAAQAAVLNTDYTAAFDDDENLVITILSSGSLASATSVQASYDKLDPTAVVADDIVGGVDTTTGKPKGLEVIDQVYPRFSLVPGTILAPGWSENSAVAAALKAKETGICGLFDAISLVDIPTDTVTKYTDLNSYKTTKNLIDKDQLVGWPKLSLSGTKYHFSTQLAGVLCKTDSANEDVPYKSPSNESLQCDAAVVGDDELFLDVKTAAYINSLGIITALNFNSGWKTWGNRTSAYPSNLDPKDNFIPVRRMFNWVKNTLITTFWFKIDAPTNKRLINSIVTSANIWLNGLTARQFLLGGRVEFREDENTTTDLMDGILHFHVYLTPPSPAREIDFIQEYDTDYIKTLFD